MSRAFRDCDNWKLRSPEDEEDEREQRRKRREEQKDSADELNEQVQERRRLAAEDHKP